MFGPKRKIGNQAESQALTYLKQQGLSLIKQNYASKRGEIDIIMRQGECLVFVEVRYRRQSNFGHAIETVDRYKQQKLIAGAEYFLQQHPEYQDFICRFDVVGIESDLKYPTIDWIKDAFEA